MHSPSPTDRPSRWIAVLAITGFIVVAMAQVSNMILARANNGVVPPFTLACVRWAIIAIALIPLMWTELRSHRNEIWSRRWLLIFAGALGTFMCGGPVYLAGITTTAINIALIFSIAPIAVLLISWAMGLETVTPLRLLGIVLALAGALVVVTSGGRALQSLSLRSGDALVLIATLSWAGYTLLQSRAAPNLSFLARIALFAAVGAVLSLPFAVRETIAAPEAVFSWHAAMLYLFAGLVPGLVAYAGFAYLDSHFGSVRTSLTAYVGPVGSTLLSIVLLGEHPDAIQLVGGALIFAGLWASLRA